METDPMSIKKMFGGQVVLDNRNIKLLHVV